MLGEEPFCGLRVERTVRLVFTPIVARLVPSYDRWGADGRSRASGSIASNDTFTWGQRLDEVHSETRFEFANLRRKYYRTWSLGMIAATAELRRAGCDAPGNLSGVSV